MIPLLLLGAGTGLGVWALVVWLVPPQPPLAELVARLRAPQKPPPI